MNRESKVSRNPRVVARELAPPRGAVLLHLESGAYHGLNPVGYVIWELIEDERRVADVVDGIRERIEDPPPQLEQDVLAFLESAAARDLVIVE